MADVAGASREDNRNIEPILVFGPCCRCGTTLVQRLLNSSGRIIVYGEDHYLVHLLETTEVLVKECDVFQSSLRNFLEGETETWSNSVLPSPTAYRDHAVEVLEGQLLKHQDWSASCGFNRWGFKYPLAKAELVDTAMRLVPWAKIIFIYRNLYDVAKSAKAREFFVDAHGLRGMARQWNRNLLHVHHSNITSNGRALLVRYEELLENRMEKLRDIERFCGITGIRAEVLNRKINAPIRVKAYGNSATGYVEPAPLSSEECAILEEEGREAMKLYGYVSTQGEVADKAPV